MQSLEFRAMNTSVLVAAEVRNGEEASLREAKAFIDDSERRFSRFLPDSELSRLNRTAGAWSDVSDDLLDLLTLSKAYYQETGGLFDPSILPDLKRAGYDASLEEVRARGNTPTPISTRPAKQPFSEIQIDAAAGRVRVPPGVEIDLGGIAKGWIVQKAAQLLSKQAPAAAVNAGGDMFFAGRPSDGARWRVEIEDPRDPDKTSAVLHVNEGAVVTSSISKRTWSQDGKNRHHLIDPRTGEPAETDWLSVTVIAPQADLAEAYAKALLVGGQRTARRLLLQRPCLAALCIDREGQISASQNSKDFLNDSNHFL